MAELHLSTFEKLTLAAIEFPEFADMCFGLAPLAQHFEGITWLDAANRLLSIQASHTVLREWMERHGSNPLIAYRLAVSHMMFGSCDIVITDANQLDHFLGRFDAAMESRRSLAQTA